jgi:hypothetical protein
MFMHVDIQWYIPQLDVMCNFFKYNLVDGVKIEC